jgi:hypothetical protein
VNVGKQKSQKFDTYKHNIQFHPAGAPVPLSIRFYGVRFEGGRFEGKHPQVEVKTSFAERNPYVLDTPMGSQIRHRKKSIKQSAVANLSTNAYDLGER